jgi:UDP-N-acetylglucosamine 2-epimerase (non-hydrolysing)
MTTAIFAVGARPNFVKMAPVIDAVARRSAFDYLVVHTGQHYDERMSSEIIGDLDFPAPDRFLGVGSGSHAEQTAMTLVAFERVLQEESPELVVVSGDVNSTLACALAASKLGIRIAHVEAGLRSWDWTMPEEINRVLTDRMSELLFTHSPEAAGNLASEGIAAERVHYVGNTMIDSLRKYEPRAREAAAWTRFGASESEYVLVTLHRPSNVDVPERLAAIVNALVELSERADVLFPIHPRTAARLEQAGELARLESAGGRCLPPLGYIDFLSLEAGAGAIVTDSGGLQEEASAFGTPCYTLRPNTERPVTLTLGTNTLLGDDPATIRGIRLGARREHVGEIPLWDGCAGERVADVLESLFASPSQRQYARA